MSATLKATHRVSSFGGRKGEGVNWGGKAGEG